jgi:hypothetical protein
VFIRAWGDMHADKVGAPDGDAGIGNLEQDAGVVFDRTAELVGAMVGAGLKKLVEEIAVGAMDLDAIEARTLCILGGQAELLDNGVNLAGFQGAGVTKGLSGRTSEMLPAATMAKGAIGSSPCRNMGSEMRPTWRGVGSSPT